MIYLLVSVLSFLLSIKFIINMYDSIKNDDLMDVLSKVISSILLIIFGFLFLQIYLYPEKECYCPCEEEVIEIDDEKFEN